MSAATKIEWATKVWNPLRGCSKVSDGCRNCYAIRQAHRFGGPGMPYEGLTQVGPGGPNWTGKIRLVPDVLDDPLRWRKPERVFVNSMSDLFHSEVPFDFIDKVFAVMALAPQHKFQILTKRPERMRDYMNAADRDEAIGHEAMYLYEKFGGRGDCSLAAGLIHGPDKVSNHPAIPSHPKAWPLPNVWLGVSVENQKAADERVPPLIDTPAAVRFLSCEPLLGPLDLGSYLILPMPITDEWGELVDVGSVRWIDWVIVGGESGPGARPMHPEWARSLRDQCQAAGVAYFFKQWGAWSPNDIGLGTKGFVARDGRWGSGCPIERETDYIDLVNVWRVGKIAAGRLLDGREWSEFPEV